MFINSGLHHVVMCKKIQGQIEINYFFINIISILIDKIKYPF